MTFFNPFWPPIYPSPIPSSPNSDPDLQLPPAKETSSRQNPIPTEFLQKIFKEPDTLIILSLLFFLYKQEEYKTPLALCLLLLLFD